LRHGPAYGVEKRVELAAYRRSKPVPSLPLYGRGAGQAVQHTCFTHKGFGNGVGLRDVSQFVIEHAGEGEQGAALVLQRDTHRANASRILGLAARQLLDDEVEQHLLSGQGWTRKRQNIMAQPLDERSDVAGQLIRFGLGLPGKRQLGDKLMVWTTLAGATGLGLQHLAA